MCVPPYQFSVSIPVLIKLHADIICHGNVPHPYTLYIHTVMQLPRTFAVLCLSEVPNFIAPLILVVC